MHIYKCIYDITSTACNDFFSLCPFLQVYLAMVSLACLELLVAKVRVPPHRRFK